MSDTKRGGWTESAAVAARWIVGALFIYMGASKAAHSEDFLKLVRQYGLPGGYLFLNAVASALPWFEIFCGALLLAGVAVRGVAVALGVLLIAFTVAVWQRGVAIGVAKSIPFCAVKFDCGCGNGEQYICRKIPENIALILMCGWLALGRGRQFCVKYSLFAGQD